MNLNKQKIHIWVPGLYQTGGIQVFSQFLIAATKDSDIADVVVFSKHDNPQELKARLTGLASFGFGRWPAFLQTLIFSIRIFFSAVINRPVLIVIALAHFAPVGMLLKKIFKIPYIVFAYGVEVWDMKRVMLKSSLEEADLILAISEYTKNRIIEQDFKGFQKIRIFPCPYDEKRFYLKEATSHSIREKHGISPNDFLLISVGRLCRSEKYKGHEIVMRAVKTLLAENPNLKYLIVGSGDLRADLEEMSVNMGIKNKIIFAGRVSEEELPDYYRASDLFIMPSTGEGFGIVYLEAMACGLPVIAGNQDGSVDALKNGELGVLVDPYSVKEIEKAIQYFKNQSSESSFPFQPSVISAKVKDEFGFIEFKKRLIRILNEILS